MKTIRLFRLAAATAALLATLQLAACVSLTPDYVYPLGVHQTVAADYVADPAAPLEDTIRTAKSGDIVLMQQLRNSSVFELENSVEPAGDVSLAVQARSVDLKQGLTFYPALNVGKESALVLCSFERPAVWVPRLNPGAKGEGKVCFKIEAVADDVDLDAAEPDLDVLSSSTFFFVSDNFGLIDKAGSYQKLFRWDQHMSYQVSSPARFRRQNVGEAAPVAGPQAALRFIADGAGGQLEPVYVTGNQPMGMEKKPVLIPAGQKFPVTLEFDGARIEVLALKDGVLAYRVLSGFSTNSVIIMDLPG